MRMPKILGRENIRETCHKDKDTGEVKCSSSRVHKDGTETTIAGFTMTADSDCNNVMTESFSNEDGALENLEKHTLPRIISKCRKGEGGNGGNESNIPQNY